MSKFQNFKLHSGVSFFLKIPRWAGEHPFLGFLILLMFVLLFSAAVFYQYVFSLQYSTGREGVVETHFDESAFQRMIQRVQERETKFEQAGQSETRNIFAPAPKNEKSPTVKDAGLTE